MIETIIVLLCAPLEDYKFRDYSELAVYANELTITHYEDERVFDIKGLAKGPTMNPMLLGLYFAILINLIG